MAGDHHHFPTFQRIVHISRQLWSGNSAHWIARTFFNERALLRLALYALLLISVLHLITTRVIMFFAGIFNVPMYSRPFGFPGVQGSGAISSWILFTTTLILGPMSELSILMIAICLVGLAASARRVKPRVVAPLKLAPKPTVAPPSPKPKAPERHPLDPDPEDVPIQASWDKRLNL